MNSDVASQDEKRAPVPSRAIPSLPSRVQSLTSQPFTRSLDGVLQRLPESNPAEGVTLGVTAARSGGGATTVASGIAMHAISRGIGPVLLMDVATRPELARLFKCPNSGMFSLRRGADLKDCVSSLAPGLDLVAADPARIMPWDASDSEGILGMLQLNYRLTVVDLPPVEELSVASALVRRLTAVALVVCAERDQKEHVSAAQEAIAAMGCTLLGGVLNQHRDWVPKFLR